MSPTRAYSYLRFSTPEQMEGDSLRRQTSLAADFALRHGLELDESLTYRDLGVSAFRGSNANVGKLGEFLEAVRVGQVPKGSFLLVESLDRISRDYAFDAQSLLSDMIRDGITVVTLLDERKYSLEGLRHDPMGMMYSIMGFMRANEESAVKSRRLKLVWENKRAALASQPLTSIVPAWLRLDPETKKIVEVPERVEIVRRIFDLALRGVGQHKIASLLNQEGLTPWGRGRQRGTQWHRSYIVRILASPAVIGSFTPHRMEHVAGVKRRVPLEVIEDYFPAVISRETWAEVQALQAARGAPRGRHASAPVASILARLAACPKCGRTMLRVSKGARSVPSLVCTVAKSGLGCEYRSVPYQVLEDRLLRVLPEFLAQQDGIDLPEDLEQAILETDQEVDALREQIRLLLDNMGHESSPALRARLRDREGWLDEAEERLRRLTERRNASSGKVVGTRIERALVALQPPEGAPLDRTETNLALRALFKRATINWPEGTIDLDWHFGGTCRIPYAWTAGPHAADDASSADM